MTEKFKNLSFYSNFGKIGAFIVYTIPVWQYFQLVIGKRSQIEKIMEVEKLSWPYLILNVICASIFTSYAFKIESVELALLNVYSLISNVFLLGVYLFIKPNQSLIV